MSGHSKWSSIKRQKGIADQKRGQVFTKLAGTITLAVRQGGGVGDPTQNFKLRLAIEKARASNMPKENIERAIEKGKGAGKGDTFDEVVYEGFSPGGVAVIVEAATDNKLRTNGEVKNIFDKNGGSIGVPGTVAYLFAQKGLITASKGGKTSDEIFLLAADSGAEDIEEAGESVLVYTRPEDVAKVKDQLVSSGIVVSEFELTRAPVSTTAVTDSETAKKVLAFLERLENLDDVQKVYANFEMSDALLA